MKQYAEPNMAVVKVELGTSFASYNCYRPITWVQIGSVCDPSGGITPTVDGYSNGANCWQGDVS